ncbi:hypothetical protein BDN72DRAFT_254648 [Pluteus cervinus]|uniref:Uncharacterized protein n=1 Tax=Pluteus cervinus TaxID=181527 RepID=A0ACD3AG84_9AGAR|nr:hypothetical protein BDN72DRAFT_254648 [Pluteus cervinus]
MWFKNLISLISLTVWMTKILVCAGGKFPLRKSYSLEEHDEGRAEGIGRNCQHDAHRRLEVVGGTVKTGRQRSLRTAEAGVC